MPFPVLVVEPAGTGRTLHEMLAGLGMRVVQADPAIDLLGQIRKLSPKLVLLALRHQHDDGFALAKQIMATVPAPIVIAAPDFDPKDPVLATQALRAGVLAVVPRPDRPGTADVKAALADLAGTIRAMAQVKVVRRWPDAKRPEAALTPASAAVPGRYRVLAIAASTGGPAAIQQVLTDLPAGLPVPVLVVQHISAGFVSSLAERLDQLCAIRVKIAEQGEELLPGVAYLAPDGSHLGVAAPCRVSLLAGPPIGGIRPSATYLFQSAAAAAGAGLCAVILTGMGEDGVEGLRQVHQAGGRVIAQDEASSVVFGMPGAAIAAGVADEILPLSSIGPRLRILLGVP